MRICISCLSILVGSYRTCGEDIADIVIGVCDILCLSSVVSCDCVVIICIRQTIEWVILVVDTFAKGFDSSLSYTIDISDAIILIARIKECRAICEGDI